MFTGWYEKFTKNKHEQINSVTTVQKQTQCYLKKNSRSAVFYLAEHIVFVFLII